MYNTFLNVTNFPFILSLKYAILKENKSLFLLFKTLKIKYFYCIAFQSKTFMKHLKFDDNEGLTFCNLPVNMEKKKMMNVKTIYFNL